MNKYLISHDEGPHTWHYANSPIEAVLQLHEKWPHAKVAAIWDELNQRMEYQSEPLCPDPQVETYEQVILQAVNTLSHPRASGRTYKTIGQLVGGDVYVTLHPTTHPNLKKIGVRVINARTLDEIESKLRGLKFNRIMFDHAVLQLIYKNEILSVRNRITDAEFRSKL